MAASATFALKAGVWFRRGRLLMVSPDSRATACPPSGRNSTYRPVQISGTSSQILKMAVQLLLGSMIPDHGELPIVWGLDLTLREVLRNGLECMVRSMF